MDKLCNIEFEILEQLSRAEGTVELTLLTNGIDHYEEILNYLIFKGYIWSADLDSDDFDVDKTNITAFALPTEFFITPAGLAAYYADKERREAEYLLIIKQRNANRLRLILDITALSISVVALVSSILFHFF